MYVFACKYAHRHASTHTHTRAWIHAYNRHKYWFTHTGMHTYTHSYTCTNLHTYVRAHVSVFVQVCACAWACPRVSVKKLCITGVFALSLRALTQSQDSRHFLSRRAQTCTLSDHRATIRERNTEWRTLLQEGTEVYVLRSQSIDSFMITRYEFRGILSRFAVLLLHSTHRAHPINADRMITTDRICSGPLDACPRRSVSLLQLLRQNEDSTATLRGHKTLAQGNCRSRFMQPRNQELKTSERARTGHEIFHLNRSRNDTVQQVINRSRN